MHRYADRRWDGSACTLLHVRRHSNLLCQERISSQPSMSPVVHLRAAQLPPKVGLSHPWPRRPPWPMQSTSSLQCDFARLPLLTKMSEHSKPNMILKALINMAFTENHTHRIFGRHLYSLLFDYGDAPFELTELDRLALTTDYAHAHALPGTQALAFSALASDVFWRRLAGDR